jgi:hypothetical protein
MLQSLWVKISVRFGPVPEPWQALAWVRQVSEFEFNVDTDRFFGFQATWLDQFPNLDGNLRPLSLGTRIAVLDQIRLYIYDLIVIRLFPIIYI